MLKDDELDALFAAERKRDPEPSDAFIGRLLGDAAEVSAHRTSSMSPAISKNEPGFWAQFADAIGGWRGGMAITTAMVIGIYIGLADPVGVDTVSGLVSSISGEIAEGETSLYDVLLEG